MAKDYLGNDLFVGDEVVFMQIRYRGLMKGVIKALSPQKATITHNKTNLGSTESIQFHDQIIKVIKP